MGNTGLNIAQKRKIIKEVAEIVRKRQTGEGSGHDWWHTYRVWQMSKQINSKERADFFVVELGALLHDIADWKFHKKDINAGVKVAQQILTPKGVPLEIMEQVGDIITTVSFKGAGVKTPMKTLAGKIIQDADRLDALGAIGIARAFAYGGHKNRPIYSPGAKAIMHQSFKHYQKIQSGNTINHFYEKLLLLKDRMNTKTGKKMALQRHKFMGAYLKRFYKEWEGKI